MAPAFSRFILSPENAAGFFLKRPTSICSSDTPSYFVSPAILRSVSPRWTTRDPDSSVFFGSATARGAGAGLAASGTDPAAGAAPLPRTVSTTRASAVAGRPAALAAISGGSRRKVYSRTTGPEGQLSSTRKSRKGSFTGLPELTLITGVPLLRFPMANRRSCRVDE